MEHMAMDMMVPYFHFGYGDFALFQAFKLRTSTHMIMACGVLFLLAIAFEYIKYIRCVTCKCRPRNRIPSQATENGGGDCTIIDYDTKGQRLIQTLLHTLQTIIGFVLMLMVMTFNVCLIFAIVLGTAIGYYKFYRPFTQTEAIESCH